MQPWAEKSQGKQDERASGMEDSPMITIEYLRARLLSERSVSKAAKERADGLAKRVTELEGQLKIVTLQRKRAEKATSDVLSFLESHGISDISEVYESEFDQEESPRESISGKSDATKEEEENFGSLESNGNDKDSPRIDYASGPSSSRSLSWKGCKQTMRLCEKKCSDSSFRRRSGFAQVSSSPRHRPGKSGCQIKKREMRLAVEESRHDSAKSDAEDRNTEDCSDHHANRLESGSDELRRSSEKRECSGDMERALEHQTLLINRYEAQEKAQRDWEEKCGDTDISKSDSCEPGSHSDITEERDESKAAASHPGKIVAGHHRDQKAEIGTIFPSKERLITHFNSFKLSPHADTGYSQNHNFSEVQASTSPSPDFVFPTVTVNQAMEHVKSHSIQAPSQNTPLFQRPPPPGILNGHHALVPHEEPHRLEAALKALQEARLLIKREMINCFPETTGGSVGRAMESSLSATRDLDWLKVPVGCSSLFRVPTDLQSQAPPSRSSFLVDSSPELANSHLYLGAPMLQGDHTSSSLVTGTEPGISTRHPRLDHFNTGLSSSSKSAFPSYPSFPESFQRMSSNETPFNWLPRSVAGVPPLGNPLLFDHDVRPKML